MPKSEIPQLTGLRFLAAFSILFLHTVVWCIPSRHNVPRAIAGAIGVFGMPLFFVLSGFVIHYNYAVLVRDQSLAAAPRETSSRRDSPLYPLFLFFMVFGSVSDFVSTGSAGRPKEFEAYIVYNVTLTQSWVYKFAIHDRLVLNHGFGLCLVDFHRVLFLRRLPFMVFAVLRLRRRGPASPRLPSSRGFHRPAHRGAEQLCLDRNLGQGLFPTSVQRAAGSADRLCSIDGSLLLAYVRIGEFIVGCLAAQVFMVVRELPITRRSGCMPASSYAVALCGWPGSRSSTATVSPCRAAWAGRAPWASSSSRSCILGAEFRPGRATRYRDVLYVALRGLFGELARLAAMVWLGEISYSLYAVHTWTLRPLIRPAHLVERDLRGRRDYCV